MPKIAGRKVGGGTERPYIVAEISGNHCGSISHARDLIKAAKWAGADAVKTQCYEPDTITLNCSTPDFIMQDGLWRGEKLYDLYSKACTPLAWHRELYKYAHDLGIAIFSSVFDRSSVDLLESLGAPAYKIASFEIVDIPLIEYTASTGKPMIISTGMASEGEIADANEASGKRAVFLYCTSEYPGTVETANLGGIYNLQYKMPENVIGLSDHTIGTLAPILATAMGVGMIEKHMKLSRLPPSADDEFSSNEDEFRDMVKAVEQAFNAVQYTPIQMDNPSRQARRSLYAVKPIKKGEPFTEDNIRSIRPGYGLPPKDLPKILGKKARKDYRFGERLSWKF